VLGRWRANHDLDATIPKEGGTGLTTASGFVWLRFFNEATSSSWNREPTFWSVQEDAFGTLLAFSNALGNIRVDPNTGEVVPLSALNVGTGTFVDIVYPRSGSVQYGDSAYLAAMATTNATGARVVRVEFYNGEVMIGSSTRYAWEAATTTSSILWTNVASGLYAIQARAYDSLGNVGVSRTIKVRVEPVTGYVPNPESDYTHEIIAPISLAAGAAGVLTYRCTTPADLGGRVDYAWDARRYVYPNGVATYGVFTTPTSARLEVPVTLSVFAGATTTWQAPAYGQMVNLTLSGTNYYGLSVYASRHVFVTTPGITMVGSTTMRVGTIATFSAQITAAGFTASPRNFSADWLATLGSKNRDHSVNTMSIYGPDGMPVWAVQAPATSTVMRVGCRAYPTGAMESGVSNFIEVQIVP